jgi:hypothetical protein
VKALVLAATLALAACAQLAPSRGWRALDLDRPGALEQLRQDNPAHYARVQKILSEAPQRPLESLPDWLRSEIGARDVEGLGFVMPGEGPRARLTFRLDERDYTALIRPR